MAAHLAKYRSLMPSLAGLLALAEGERSRISLRHAQQAGDWCDYLESHARRIYSMIISPQRAAAAELGKRLSEGWRRNEGFFTVRDVYRNEWSRLGNPEEVRAALPFLRDAGWVREQPIAERGGRPSELFAINPRIYQGGGK
jgi:putative DNA primase/helicase